ncbi:hypothetical protein A2673_03395 [Candidatus Kaiserbacteria bacterium RIFCSPHIGHO2_01_FULL_50_13]|nr:MAG: hypothetical protein A2673_03395 [Candidatus Kaiserbacteria bacterium RIFCSPHIGHO2_01_FULL_50_13]
MKKIAHALAVAFLTLGLMGGAYMEAASQERSGQERVVSLDEFYYFDANGLRVPLKLSNSIAVRFLTVKLDTEKRNYLDERYAPLAIRDIKSVYARAEYALEYSPLTNQAEMREILKRMSADSDIDAAPVFIVDGMETLVDGVYVETTTPLSSPTLKNAIEKLFGGGALLHEITPEKRAWHLSFRKLFFLDNEKIPLHALSFANLIHKGGEPWVKRAYPKFAYLQEPVVASLTVTPISGTVGEERTAVLTLRIFGKTESDVVIDEGDIPELQQGKFSPLSSGKPPQVSFFNAAKGFVRNPRRQVGPNEWYIEHWYRFGIYAPEAEWVIAGIQIPYQYKGERRVLTVPTVTFFVRPHLDAKYKLVDIPEALSLDAPQFAGFSQTEPAPTRAWFDLFSWVFGGRGALESGSLIVFATFGGVALGSMLLLVGRAIPRRERGHGITKAELKLLLGQARSASDPKTGLNTYNKAISLVFHTWNSAFPRQNLTYQFVKDRLKELREEKLLERLQEAGVEDVFSAIEARHDASFGFGDAQDKNEFADKCGSLERGIQAIQNILMPNMR